MAWNDLAANQGVSFDSLRSAVVAGLFQVIGTLDPSAKIMTKAEALAAVALDTSNATLSPKSSNQLVMKRDFTSSVNLPYSYTLRYTAYVSKFGSFEGWPSSGDACVATTYLTMTVYSSSSSLGAGVVLYGTATGGAIKPDGIFAGLNIPAGYRYFFCPTTAQWIYSDTISTPSNGMVIGSVGVCAACKEYYNNTGSPITVYPNDCNGNPMGAVTVDPGQSICAQEGTVGGWLIEIGNC